MFPAMALAGGVLQLLPMSGLGMYLLQIIGSRLDPMVEWLWNSRTGVKILAHFIFGTLLDPLPAVLTSIT